MARKTTQTSITYRRVNARRAFSGKPVKKLKPVKKIKHIEKTPRKLNEYDALRLVNKKDRASVLKSKYRNQTTRVLGAGAETATTTVTVGSANSNSPVNYNNSVADLKQNVDGGIQKTSNQRDEDEEEDYPGVN